MPFSITTKDGITVNGIPDDVDPNDDRLKRLVAATRAQQRPAKKVDVSQDVGPFEAVAIGAGRGLTKIGRAVGIADPETEFEKQQFEQLEETRPIASTVGEIAGETAPFLLPGSAIGSIGSAATRFVSTALLGALEGAAITRGEGADVKGQFAGAGIGGVAASAVELVLPRISRVGRQVIRRVLGKAPGGAVVDAAGQPSQEFISALQSEGKSFDEVVAQVNDEIVEEIADPDQFARKAFLESQGITPTKAQITREAVDFQAQQEAAKTSGAVRDALEVQESVLTSRFDNAVLGTGGQAVTPTSTVTDALVGKATVLDKEISQLYQTTRGRLGTEKVVKFTSTLDLLKKLKPSNRRANGNIQAMMGALKNKGVVEKGQLVGRLSVDDAEDVRKLANELFDPQNSFANGILRQVKEAIDDDVFTASGDDVFSQARAAKAKFESDLTRAKVSKFDTRKDNLVRDILENKNSVDPDQFVDKVVFNKKWRATDIQQLKDYISTDEAGRQAFDDLRAETLDSIKNKAFFGPKDRDGVQALSRDKLQRALNSIGLEKMKVLFSEEERGFFRDMLKVTELREPVRGTAIGRGPSAQAIGKLEQKLRNIPIFGNLVDFIDFDASGKAVLKARTARKPLTLQTSQPVSQLAVAGAIPSEESN